MYDDNRRTPPPRRRSRESEVLEALGPVRERAGMGQRSRGLQPRRDRLGLLPARPRALARLSMERRRTGRDLRPPPAHLLRAGAVEPPRSDSEGAAVRP